MGTKYTAKFKLNWMWNKLEEQGIFGLGYEEKQLIAEFVIAHGTTRRTALDLIKIFEDAKKIIRKEGKIYSKAFFNDDLSIKEEIVEPQASNEEKLTSEEEAIINV
jgi:hypothetical protein